jgi:hypothetical protein
LFLHVVGLYLSRNLNMQWKCSESFIVATRGFMSLVVHVGSVYHKSTQCFNSDYFLGFAIVCMFFVSLFGSSIVICIANKESRLGVLG